MDGAWTYKETIQTAHKWRDNGLVQGGTRGTVHPPKLTYGLKVVIMNQNVPELSATGLYF